MSGSSPAHGQRFIAANYRRVSQRALRPWLRHRYRLLEREGDPGFGRDHHRFTRTRQLHRGPGGSAHRSTFGCTRTSILLAEDSPDGSADRGPGTDHYSALPPTAIALRGVSVA